MRTSIALLFLLFTAAASANQIHVCTDADGKKSFQQQPCPQGAKAETRTYEKSEPVAAAPDNRLSTDNPTYQTIKNNNRRLELERNIKKSERKVDELESRRSRELAALRNKKRYANNNMAGATWEQSISTEMQAVSERYSSMIETERDELKRMREELREVSK